MTPEPAARPAAVVATASTSTGRRFRGLAWLLPATAAACVLRAGLLLPPLLMPASPVAVQAAAEPDPPAEPVATGPAASVQAIAPAAGTPPADPPAAALPAPAGAADPPLNPQALLEVARELKRRREEIELRERDLAAREAGLRVVEGRLAAKVDQLEILKRDLEGLLGRLSADEAGRIDRLVKVYEAMKPARAAAIFDATDLGLLVPVVKRMREAKVAAIVEGMDPGKARALTLELARAKELPALSAPPPASGAAGRAPAAGKGGPP